MHERNIVAVIDGGGRGASLVHDYSRSPHVGQLIAIPGNDLMGINTEKPVDIFPSLRTTDVPAIVALCKESNVSLVDVPQDNAIAAGLVDALQKAGIPTLGPTREAAEIEWNKAFARDLADAENIPIPTYKVFSSVKQAEQFLINHPDQPWFVKANGLAEGKGALPAKNNDEAMRLIEEMKRFGNAGEVFLLEQWLEGEEFSTFALCDGQTFKIIGSAQDHKRINNFDTGDNTGGMGASTPPLILTPEIMREVETGILEKTVRHLSQVGRPYTGIIYVGGMIVVEAGKKRPYVIEYNARWGDPEKQVMHIEEDMFEVSMAAIEGNLHKTQITVSGKSRVVITGAARGYPGDYSQVKGKQIFGLDEARAREGVTIYSAGISRVEGKYYANGGRLLYVVGQGENVIEARERAYLAMARISIDGNNLHYRTDIGWRDVARLRGEV